MYRVNHNQKHLADEFMADPLGRPSPELQRVLIAFRGEAIEGQIRARLHQTLRGMDARPAHGQARRAAKTAAGAPLHLAGGRGAGGVPDALAQAHRARTRLILPVGPSVTKLACDTRSVKGRFDNPHNCSAFPPCYKGAP